MSRGIKRNFILILITFLVFSLFSSTVLANTTQVKYEDEANKLKTLGLFLGSNKGFELDRSPNRAEAAVMLVRLLGKENEVNSNQYSHPFTDVPSWANQYVGYMYENGLTKGIGTNKFGSNDLINTNSYVTFLLRALGYDDTRGDFSWNHAIDKGAEVGIIDNSLKNTYTNNQFTFLRDDLVHLSYTSLSVNLKNQEKSLAEKLIEQNAFTVSDAEQVGLNVKNAGQGNEGILPSLTAGLSVTVLEQEQIVFMEFNPSTLPDNLKQARIIDFGGTGFNSAQEFLLNSDINDKNIYNSATIGDSPVRLETTIMDGQNALIKLYDENKNLISVTVIGSNQFISSDFRFIYFEGEVYNNTRIDAGDFVVERYVNGVLDTSFSKHFSFGTEYFKAEITLTDTEAIINQRPGYFKCGPIFLESDKVEYKIRSLNPDLRNLVIRHY